MFVEGIEEERGVTEDEADKSMESEKSNEAVGDGKETTGELIIIIFSLTIVLNRFNIWPNQWRSRAYFTETVVEESESEKDAMPPAAIVQLPQDLVQLLLPQKPPVKIGTKLNDVIKYLYLGYIFMIKTGGRLFVNTTLFYTSVFHSDFDTLWLQVWRQRKVNWRS